jgi:hypothetical protein
MTLCALRLIALSPGRRSRVESNHMGLVNVQLTASPLHQTGTPNPATVLRDAESQGAV